MKHAILLVAGLLASASVAAAANCYPADINGTGSFAVVGETWNDRYAGWKCPAAGTTPAMEVYFVAHKKDVLKAPAFTGMSYSAVLDAYLNLNVKKDVNLPEFAEALATLKHDLKFVKIPPKSLPVPKTVAVNAKSLPSAKVLARLNPAGVMTPVYSAEDNIKYEPDNNPVMQQGVK